MNVAEIRRWFSVRWRRWKVKRAYGKIAEAELEKSVGFTPIMLRFHLLHRDGYVEYDDGDVVWKWP